MAEKKIGVNVDIPVGQAEANAKSLKAALRELKNEILSLEETDPRFDKLTKEAAALEDKIGDVNQRVKALASDTKNLEGFTATVQGVAGAFAAAAGAAALFGEGNEELEKSILKVQGAMSLLNGVQEIANQLNKDSAAAIFLQAQAMKVYTAAVGTSTGALKAFRIALIATGIGALVVALGLIVANWDKITKAIGESIMPLNKFGEVFNEVKKIAAGVFDGIIAYFKTILAIMQDLWTLDFEGAIENAKNLGKNVAKAYSEGFEEEAAAQEKERQDAITRASIGDQKRALARLEASGKETYDARKKILEDELKLLEEGSEEYMDKENEIQVLRLANEKKLADERNRVQEESRKKREEEEKRAAEKLEAERIKREEEIAGVIADVRKKMELDRLQGQERELRILEMEYEKQLAVVAGNLEAERLLQENYLNDVAALTAKYQDEAILKQEQELLKQMELETKYATLRLDQREQELLAVQQKYEQDRQAAKGNAELLAMIEEQSQRDLSALREKYRKEDQEKEKEHRAKIQGFAVSSATATADILSNIATIVGDKSRKAAKQQFELQKAASIVNTGIKTFESAQSAYAALAPIPYVGPVLGALAAAAAVAAGIANINNIRAQQFDGGGTVNPATPASIPSSASTPQQAPQLAQDVQRTRIGANDEGELKLKVFVTESDITQTQGKVRSIEQKATVE